MPTMPPAPPRFSITNGWPSASASLVVSARAVMSLPPPGAKGTITFTGFEGYGCACAAHASVMHDRSIANRSIDLPGSVDRDARGLHELAPLVALGADVRGEGFGRSADGLHAERGELPANLVGREDALDRCIELHDHRARRAGGRHDAAPRERLVARDAGLLEGRDVGQVRQALAAGHGEGAPLSRLDERQRRRRAVE